MSSCYRTRCHQHRSRLASAYLELGRHGVRLTIQVQGYRDCSFFSGSSPTLNRDHPSQRFCAHSISPDETRPSKFTALELESALRVIDFDLPPTSSQCHRRSANRPESPNHALQRTAPGVTACAPARRPAPATFPHRLRRPPQSLSLGSLGASRVSCERKRISSTVTSPTTVIRIREMLKEITSATATNFSEADVHHTARSVTRSPPAMLSDVQALRPRHYRRRISRHRSTARLIVFRIQCQPRGCATLPTRRSMQTAIEPLTSYHRDRNSPKVRFMTRSSLLPVDISESPGDRRATRATSTGICSHQTSK